MRWLPRRRARRGAGFLAKAADDTAEAGLPAVRIERAVLALATHAHQLQYRLERLERRVENHRLDQMDLVTHEELLDARLHSAKVATEVARLSIDLRTAVQDVHDKVAGWEDREWRVTTLAASIADLDDGLDTTPADLADEASVAEQAARRRHPSMAFR